MDTKRLILNLTLVAALVLGYQLTLQHFAKLHPEWVSKPDVTPTASPTPGTALANSSTMPATVTAGGGLPTTGPAGFSPATSHEVMPATLGSNSTQFPMVLEIDPLGAGLKSVTLSDYRQSAAQNSPLYVFEGPTAGLETDTRALATRSVTINGQDVDLSAVNWMRTSISQDSATYMATIVESGHPALALTKTFKLVPRTATDASQGFDITVNMAFRNLTEKPLKVSTTFNGPTPPGRENDRSEDRRYISGHDDGAGDKWVDAASTSVGDLKKNTAPTDLTVTDPHPLLWVGACSSYFQAIYRPDYAGQSTTPDVKIASALASGLDAGAAAVAGDYPTSLQISTTDFTLQPGHEEPFNAHVFFGPKKRQLLENKYYAAYPLSYDKNLVYTGGFCGFLTFNWLINVLYAILAFFHLIFRDWGIAIICLVCLVRLLLHPITKRSQISMMEMGKKGPEIERLKLKFKDNKEELNKAMMEVMNPAKSMLGCLPMFLQTPIWIALWNALQSTFELRQSGFLRWQHLHLTWIADLSHPDALITLANPIYLYFFTLHSINILPLLVGCVSFAQQSMVPAPVNMTPEQEQQRKMQRWMLLLFPIMLYVGPSGLNLYILTSSTIGMIESKIIRDHIKEKEEAEKAGKIIVDAPPTRGNKRKKDDDFKKAPPKKPTGIAGWLANLQAQAEQVRREAERRSKDRA